MVQPLQKTVGQFLTKQNISLPEDSEISLTGIYPNKLKIYVHTKSLHMDAYNSFIHNCQTMEETKMSFSKWINGYTVVHLDNGILFNTSGHDCAVHYLFVWLDTTNIK